MVFDQDTGVDLPFDVSPTFYKQLNQTNKLIPTQNLTCPEMGSQITKILQHQTELTKPTLERNSITDFTFEVSPNIFFKFRSVQSSAKDDLLAHCRATHSTNMCLTVICSCWQNGHASGWGASI